MKKATIEVGFYFVVVILFYGFVIPHYGGEVSAICNRHFCRHYLTENSSINHRAVDLTDNQWREFRSSLKLAIFAAMTMTSLHEIYRLFRKPTVFFHLICGICFLIVQHGWHSIVVISIILVSYIGGKYFRRSNFGTVWTWLFGLFVIFLKESYRVQNHRGFEFLQILFDRRYSGLYPWNVSANFLVLRLISFNLDSIWSSNQKIENELDSPQSLQKVKSDTTSNDINPLSHSIDDYSLVTCLAYVLYPPLYIAGPIISFNAYYHNTKSRQQTENVFMYAVRWCFAFVLLEFATSYFPFFAIVKSGLQTKLSPPQLAVFSYVLLKMMWLKFLIIWRFFRLWALADGVNPPENMLRCMSNNCSLSDFWKGWHSSFNLWIVRYMYVPLGGKTTQIWNVWPIFLFVAIWHDIEPKLLAWGGLNSLFYILEIIGKKLSRLLLGGLHPIIRQAIEVFCSAFYILVLIAINLLGYAIGVGGVSSILTKMLSQEGILTLISTFCFLLAGVCLMDFIKQKRYIS